MARKKKQEEHENHERWLISYADFITLLFAFFVVMYSISSVNEGKYRVLSDSLVTAFGNPHTAINPIKMSQSPSSPIVDPLGQKHQPIAMQLPMPLIQQDEEEQKKLRNLEQEVRKNMRTLIDKDLVNVSRQGDGVEIEINTSILFESGKARLQFKAIPTLKKIAATLAKKDYRIQVEGFTDNVPINTEIYPSNWELSASRAASVVHLFTKNGIAAEQLAAVGYGEYRPIVKNTTEQGRKRNRRVVVVIRTNKRIKQTKDDVQSFSSR